MTLIPTKTLCDHRLSSTTNCTVSIINSSSVGIHTTFPTYYYGTPIVVVLSLILIVSMILAVIGNLLVVFTIVRHRDMRTRTNLLLANLAVADILVAVLDMPIALITLINGTWMFSQKLCDFNGFTVGLGIMLSIHTLMWISIHKFVSITAVMSRRVTRKQIVAMIVTAWIWSVFYNLLPFFSISDTVYKKGASQCGPVIPYNISTKIHSTMNTTINFLLPVSVMSFCYYKIFAEVRQHLSNMNNFSNAGDRNSMVQQHRIVKTLLIVLSCFMICVTPYIVYSTTLVIYGKDSIWPIFNPLAYLAVYMNSVCNPIIYAFRSKSFRRAFHAALCCDNKKYTGGSSRHGSSRYGYRGNSDSKHAFLASVRSHEHDHKKIHKTKCEHILQDSPRPTPFKSKECKVNCQFQELKPYKDSMEQTQTSNLIVYKSELKDNSDSHITSPHKSTCSLHSVHKISEERNLNDSFEFINPICKADVQISVSPPSHCISKSASDSNLTDSINNLSVYFGKAAIGISHSHRDILEASDVDLSHSIKFTSMGNIPRSSNSKKSTSSVRDVPERKISAQTKRILQWQASLDYIESPSHHDNCNRRKEFHIRRNKRKHSLTALSLQVTKTIDRIRRKSNVGIPIHLGVPLVVNSMRRSFIDLFGASNVEQVNKSETYKSDETPEDVQCSEGLLEPQSSIYISEIT